MSFTRKISTAAQKKLQKIKHMELFQRPSSKRKNSRNLVKRYCRLIK